MFAFLMSLMFPKRGKPGPKARKPIPRRGPFRPKDNPLKTYRAPSPHMKAVALQRRAEHLESPTPAEKAFACILRDMGYIESIHFERESIAYYPASFVLFDFYFRAHRVAWEIDGSAHDDRGQHAHDEGRDRYFRMQGIRTIRVRNRVVLTRPDIVRSLILAELGGK
jgi:very-short-patch-repair endonuclease